MNTFSTAPLIKCCLVCTSLLVGCADSEPPAFPQSDVSPPPRTPISDGAADQSTDRPTASYLKSEDLTEQELGIPLYPGATPVASDIWNMTGHAAEGAASRTSIRIETTDPIDKVAEFYRARLDIGSAQSFEYESSQGKTISLTVDSATHASSNVVLRQQQRGTQIDISVMGTTGRKDD